MKAGKLGQTTEDRQTKKVKGSYNREKYHKRKNIQKYQIHMLCYMMCSTIQMLV